MKIAFISGYPIGLQGSTGTYKIPEALLKYCEVRIFSPPAGEKYNIVDDCKGLPVFPLKNLDDDINARDTASALDQFGPDIIYIFNHPLWPDILNSLKKYIPAKYVLDVKTPLLRSGEERKKIQSAGDQAHADLDGILTLAKSSVKTWIPNCSIDPVVYPLSIDISFFDNIESSEKHLPLKRFIFTGSLHPLRKIDTLIESFCMFAIKSAHDVSLDIFGQGQDYERLSNLVTSKRIQDVVKMRGLIGQKELMFLLPQFDAGIAWVPGTIYNDSPSLKILEYMASSLPVIATSTDAHNILLTQGYTFHTSPCNIESFAEKLHEFSENGLSLESIEANFKSVSRRDFSVTAKEHILPFLENIHNRVYSESTNKFPEKRQKILLDQGHNKEKKQFSAKKKHVRRRPSFPLTLVLLCASMAAGKGGTEKVAMDVANEMSRRGHLVYMAYKSTGSPAYQSDSNVVLLPYHSLDMLKFRIQSIDPDVFFVFYFNRYLIDYYSIVHDCEIPFGMQECSNPVRICENNWDVHEGSSIKAQWEREVIASAAARIRLTMESYADSFPSYIRNSVRCYPNPCFLKDNLSTKISKLSEKKYILNINGFKANKNLLTLLQAFHRLKDIFNDWNIKVVGKSPDGPQDHKKKILRFIEDHDLQDRIVIVAPTDNIYDHYASSQLHVIASLSEGCPTVVLEAMSMGIPSIGFEDCPGTNELIKHGVNGLLASSKDRVKGLEIAMFELMSFPEVRCRLGQKALEDSKSFDPKTIYDQWEKLFHEAAEYKNDSYRLFREQLSIDDEKAMHARRMRNHLIERFTK